LRQQGRHEGSRRKTCEAIAGTHFAQKRRRVRSAGRRRHACHLCIARHRVSGALRRPAQGSAYSVDGADLEGPSGVVRQSRYRGRHYGRRRALRPVRPEEDGNRKMSEMIQRYTYRERVMHWLTALAYTYCLATGVAFYTPYLFWIALILGGGPT